MNINPSWNFRDCMRNLMALKAQYVELLASFSYIKDRNDFIRSIKKQIYSLNFNENKKDEIWVELNRIGEFEIYEEDSEFNDKYL